MRYLAGQNFSSSIDQIKHWCFLQIIVTIGVPPLRQAQGRDFRKRPEQVAEKAGTIAYELMTRVGARVHRIYVEP